MKTFNIVGEVDEKVLEQFYEFVLTLDTDDRACINISSCGGDSDVALAIAGIMRRTRIFWHCQAFGYLYSAAVLIFAAGQVRRFSKYAFAMVHEGTEKVRGNATSIENYANHMQQYERHWNSILEELTTTPESTWAALSESETYLDAHAAFEHKLATEII